MPYSNNLKKNLKLKVYNKLPKNKTIIKLIQITIRKNLCQVANHTSLDQEFTQQTRSCPTKKLWWTIICRFVKNNCTAHIPSYIYRVLEIEYLVH